MRKTLYGLCLVFMCLSFTCQINAAEIEGNKSGVDVKEKVYKEIRNGKIISEEDAIRVAMEQYEERKRKALYKNGESVDNSFSITQIVDEYVLDGSVMQNIRTTNLLVMDKDNNIILPASVHSGSGSLSDYQIYAYMNVDITVDTSNAKVGLNWFTTTLNYGTAMKAASLRQDSKYAQEPFFEYDDVVKTTNTPSANKAYKYIPNYKAMVNFINIGTGRSCRSIVKAGSRTMILAFGFTNSSAPNGEWSTAYE